jgi:murein L,D-transpeptidase YcbB/YkuD
MRANLIKKTVTGFFLAATLAGVAGCGGTGDNAAGGGSGSAPASAPASAPSTGGSQADLGNVPEVVATVNEEKISKDEFSRAYQSQFQQASMQAQQTGQPVDQDQLKTQVAESMVGTVLLSQEAERRGFDASATKVDKTLTDLAKQNGMKSDEQFLQALKKQGMSAEDVRSQVADQVKIDQLMAKEAGNTKPTQAELKKLYQQAKSQQQASGQQGEMPPFKEVRSQLVEQAKTEKENKVGQELVTSLRKQGEVKINL